MVYTTTIQGITCTSNVNPSASNISGSTYTHTISFTAPFISALGSAGANFLNYIDPNYVKQQFAGAGHIITNLQITAPNNSQMSIKYTCTSPTLIEAVTLIVGIVLAVVGFIIAGPLGAAAGLLLTFLAGAALIISTIYTQISAPAPHGSLLSVIDTWVIPGLVVVGVVGAGFLIYGSIKHGTAGSDTEKVYQGTRAAAGKAAKTAATVVMV